MKLKKYDGSDITIVYDENKNRSYKKDHEKFSKVIMEDAIMELSE